MAPLINNLRQFHVRGEYYGPGGIMEMGVYPVLVGSSAASHNVEDARRLWQVPEELSGVTFGQLDQVTTR